MQRPQTQFAPLQSKNCFSGDAMEIDGAPPRHVATDQGGGRDDNESEDVGPTCSDHEHPIRTVAYFFVGAGIAAAAWLIAALLFLL